VVTSGIREVLQCKQDEDVQEKRYVWVFCDSCSLEDYVKRIGVFRKEQDNTRHKMCLLNMEINKRVVLELVDIGA